MADKLHVEGEKKGDIVLYALSTCGWCKKTKKLLADLGVEYHFVDVDLLEGEPREEVLKELEGWNPRRTFPTLVVNDECIVGFKEDKIKEALGS
jgi:glutaredoxin-like protein NrdH